MQTTIERKVSRRKPAGAGAVSLAVIAVLAIFVIPGFAHANYVPATALEPNPALAGNITYSNHFAGWAPLQYTDQFGASHNLTASLDPTVINPIVVTPTDIIAPGVLQGEKVGGTYWNSTTTETASVAGWSSFQPAGGGVVYTGPTVTTINGQPAVTFTVNDSGSKAGVTETNLYKVPLSLMPSTNTAFDYMTFAASISGPACPVANECGIAAEVGNVTNSAFVGWAPSTGAVAPGTVDNQTTTIFVSASLAQMTGPNAGLNFSGKGATTAVGIGYTLLFPKGSTTAFTITVTAVALSTGPLTLGNTYWAAKTKANIARGSAYTLNLTAIAPSYTFTNIAGGGYTAAVVEKASNLPSQNVTISEVALVNGSEQVTYSFGFGLPSAPSLSYIGFSLKDVPELAAWQYTSINFGGSSYISTYQLSTSKGNYTTIVSTVTPTVSQSWTGTMTYTQSQWVTLSSAPGVFSQGWFAFNFWWLVGAFAGILGVGGTVAFAARKQAATRIR